MPVYVYRRRDGSTFEIRQRMAEDALVDCPTTGQRVERVLQPFTPRYTGTGFYATDHRTPNGKRQSPDQRSRPDLQHDGLDRQHAGGDLTPRPLGDVSSQARG